MCWTKASLLTWLETYSNEVASAIQLRASWHPAPFFASPTLSTRSPRMNSAVVFVNVAFCARYTTRSTRTFITCSYKQISIIIVTIFTLNIRALWLLTLLILNPYHLRFFFLHTFFFWMWNFNNAVTLIANISHIEMTLPWHLVTSWHSVTSTLTMACHVLYNQCTSNTWVFFLSYPE